MQNTRPDPVDVMRKTTMTKIPLHWQILSAIVLAFFAGWITDKDTMFLGLSTFATFDFFGKPKLPYFKKIAVFPLKAFLGSPESKSPIATSDLCFVFPPESRVYGHGNNIAEEFVFAW